MNKTKLFWADKKAEQVVERRSGHSPGDPELGEYVIKTSASISGVLHIGRLSDAIRSESVCRALVDGGYKAKLIWVAEDMDPLRRVPEGVPESYAEYIGLPVVKIPDPWGCHRSYADHHVSEYKEVLEKFLAVKPECFSMEEEYRKGSFRKYVKIYLDRIDELRGILGRYREKPLAEEWSPWLPVCKSCGRVITPRVERIVDGEVYYTCQDYVFEGSVAKGCGYEGVANPLRDEGKLLWKGEWAAQWARWRVAAEGAGKEYNVPGSAWFVNAEIAARILSYPPPEPIFYEHIMFKGEKMSASHGNVIYPSEWLETAPPEALRLFLLKKIGKTRSFDWLDLPRLVEEYDNLARWYQRVVKREGEKWSREEAHRRRLYEMVRLPTSPVYPNPLPYSLAVTLAQVFPPGQEERVLKALKKLGHLGETPTPTQVSQVLERLAQARRWVELHAPGEQRFYLLKELGPEIREKLSKEQQHGLGLLAELLEESWEKLDAERLEREIFRIAREEVGLDPPKFFQGVYLVLVGKPHGPRAANFILSLDKSFVVERFRAAAEGRS